MFRSVKIPKTRNITNFNKFKSNNLIKNARPFQQFNNLQQKRHNATDIAFYLTSGMLLGSTLTYFVMKNNNTNHNVNYEIKVNESRIKKDDLPTCKIDNGCERRCEKL